MAKLALIAVAIFVTAGTHMVFNNQRNLHESETQLAEDQFEILARNAALSGIDRVQQKLSDEFQDYSYVQGNNDGIAYQVNAVTNGQTVVVHSTASATTSTGETVEFNVQAKYRRRVVLPSEAPPFMRYAIISDEDLVLSGTIDGDIYVDGNQNNQLNANMHSNNNMGVVGNSALVKGFGTFVLTASPSEAAIADNFIPNDNPSGAAHCYQTEEVPIPPMNPVDLAMEMAASIDSTTIGDVELSGTYNLGGDRDDPYIWHITGNLEIKNGGTRINGYIMFIVEGSADLKADVEVGSSGYTGGDESSIAFYTGGSLTMRGNSEIWGQIYTQSDVIFDAGTPKVYGSITTKGAVDFRGTVDIFYRKASPALTTPFQPSLFMLDPIGYSEW